METVTPTPEEIAAEQAATKEVKEEEVRAAVISEYGFDEETDKERIDKLVTKEMENHKKLSTAIGQKIKHRTEAEALRNDPRLKPPPSQDATKTVAPEEVEKVVAQTLEKRDLDSLDYPDELKKEIQRVAKVQNISIKQATRDPYIAFKIGEYEKEQKVQEASIKRTNKSAGKKDYSLDNPPDVDMSTPEGRAEWDAYKAAMVKEGN